MKRILFLAKVMMILSLTACNGIFDGIYDDPITDPAKDFGFVVVDDKTNTGRIYIDATEYTKWHYIDFGNKEVVTKNIDDEAPVDWDFAIHRYDAKTNGGAVMESDVTDFVSIPNINNIPENKFIVDEWTTNKITVDMSQMMNGVILYAEDYYNPCLSQWLKVDTSQMPPTYILSGKVYLLRISDGSYAALRLSNYMNDSGVKGFITIDYLYPVRP